MEVNGMKKVDKKPEQTSSIRFSVNILPFGELSFSMPPSVLPPSGQKEDIPVYVEPSTTGIKQIEISYEEGDTYLVPRTTAGL